MEKLQQGYTAGEGTWIAANVTVLGDITFGSHCSVWFGTVIRAEKDVIRIGSNVNIQDLSLLHVDPGFPVEIADDVTIGHAAVIHGAKVGSNSLIGMRSTLLNGAKVGRNCIVGANSLVTEGKEVPDGTLAMGSPAKVVRDLTPEEIERVRRNWEVYVELAKQCRAKGY